MLEPTHWVLVFFISKTVGHHFWPRLTAGVEIEQGRKTKKKKNNSPEAPSQKRKNQAPS
jgi:hypothetical protein